MDEPFSMQGWAWFGSWQMESALHDCYFALLPRACEAFGNVCDVCQRYRAIYGAT